jgi:ribosomal-protein-alanine N-acetyltransferase
VIVFETERLRLREFTPDDAAFILELVNEPGWLRFIGDRKVHSLEDARGYIAKAPVASYAKHGFGLWAVELAATGERIGMCGLIKRELLEHVDLGFAFLERHWGHGYARESAAAVVRLARERFHLPKLLAITDVDNRASQKVLADLGFLYDKLVHAPDPEEELSLYVLDLPPAGG